MCTCRMLVGRCVFPASLQPSSRVTPVCWIQAMASAGAALEGHSVLSVELTAFGQPRTPVASSLAKWYAEGELPEYARGQRPTVSSLPALLFRQRATKEVAQEDPGYHLCSTCGAI